MPDSMLSFMVLSGCYFLRPIRSMRTCHYCC